MIQLFFSSFGRGVLMKKVSCGYVVVHCLESEGVEMIFGQPGSHNLAIYDALRKSKSIRYINVKHEENAAVMADVYGRLTGKPGVCLTTAGPGATNCITAVAQAYAARSPVIHICGHCETTSVLPFHGLYDPNFLMNVFQPVTKESFSVQRGSMVAEVFAEAFYVAQRWKKGPVHIEIPKDILEAETEFDRYPRKEIPLGEVKTNSLLEAVKILRNAKAPILLAGQGVTRDFASEQLIRLAEALSAPVMTPWNGRSAIPFDHPLAFGFAISGGLGQFIHPTFKEIINESDTVVVVGSDPGEALYEFVKKHPVVIYLDHCEDTEPIQKVNPALILNGNIREILRLILIELEGFRFQDKAKERANKTIKVRNQIQKAAQEFIERNKDPHHVGAILGELNKVIREDAIVASDTGIIDSWMFSFFHSHWPHNLLTSGRYGSMGFALPAAIASRICFPERPVIALCGDGSFLMSSADFGTAVENGLKIIFVILNDKHFGTIRKMQDMFYHGRYYGTEILTPDFVQFAASYGVKGFSIDRFSEIGDVFEEATLMDGPVVINIDTDSQVPFFSIE
jgi:acetolactate synthase-1/2/3 large subunit